MIDLLKFCGENREYPEFLKPFTKGSYTYATDGHICVRVPIKSGYSDSGENRHQYIDDCIDNGSHKFMEIPSFALPPLDFVEECEDIPARTVMAPSAVAFDELGECFGINLCYLSWIMNLPEPLISFNKNDVGGYVVFRFNGGSGVVMPMLT